MDSKFFPLVLAHSGRYCIALINGSAVKHRFSTDIDSLLDVAAEADTHGTNAYFALATFGEEDSRTAVNAKFMRSLFLDIDCGAEKPYTTLQDGASALSAFVAATKLPEPIVVISGGGLHCYWPLTRDLPIDRWKPLASALKALCRAHGLQADPAVTADAARVLRIPGTHNHKPVFEAPPEVSVRHWGDAPSDPDELRKLLPVLEMPVDLSAAKVFADDGIAKALVGERKPSKFAKIVRLSLADGGQGCGQIRRAVLDAAVLPEPEWRAALSIAWNCVDAEKSIHRLSSLHPGYTPEGTLAKAERLTDKPHTCAWYKDNYPDACKGCKHKVTSPIQLGSYVEEAPTDGEDYVVKARFTEAPEGEALETEVHIPKYPYPYFRGANGGVYKYEISDDSQDDTDAKCVEVYAHDLYVTGRFYDNNAEGEGDGELVGINLHLPHDGLRQFHVPVVNLVSADRLRDALARHGVVCIGSQIKLIMSYIASALKKLQHDFSAARTRSQMGWTPEGSFVVGDLEYVKGMVRLAPPSSGTRQLAGMFRAAGSLDVWRNVIRFYNRPGMESHAFAFLVGAGSPLLSLLNSTQVRGAVLNLVSNASGTGKTTVQMAVNSIYGHPVELLMESRDTAAARFHRLGALNSICMTVDELTSVEATALSAIVYGSTSGRGAHRMEAQGNKLRANETTWCSVTMTSANSVMSEVLQSARVAIEGELRRVIDLRIDVPQHIPKVETDALFRQLADNHGVAGPILAAFMVENRERIVEYMRELQLKIDREAGFERSDRFYSAVCTIAFTVAHFGNELGLWEFDIERIYQSAIASLAGIKESNNEMLGTPDTMAMELITRYLSENLMGAFVINKSGANGLPAAPIREPRGPFKFRYEPDTDELIVPATELKNYFVARRVDVRSSMATLVASNVLKPATNGETTVVRRPLSGAVGAMAAPSTRCYVFKASALGGAVPVELVDGPAEG